MHSKTLTILMADIQGFTSRTSSQTREENELFIRETNSFVVKHVDEFGGRLVKSMGDGFLITFESPTNAIKCGLSMQKEISRRNANVMNCDNFIKFRIGISTGEVNINKEGDVFGDAVNIAARIESFAEPNQVFISESTYLSMNHSEVSAMDLGPKQFKNVVREIRVYRVLDGQNELPVIENIREKKSEFSKYKYLLAGLAFGILVMGVLLTAILFSAGKSGLQILPEKTDTALEHNEATLAENSESPSGSTLNLNPAVPSGENSSFYETDEIQLVEQGELIRLQIGLAFLEWAVKTEE